MSFDVDAELTRLKAESQGHPQPEDEKELDGHLQGFLHERRFNATCVARGDLAALEREIAIHVYAARLVAGEGG